VLLPNVSAVVAGVRGAVPSRPLPVVLAVVAAAAAADICMRDGGRPPPLVKGLPSKSYMVPPPLVPGLPSFSNALAPLSTGKSVARDPLTPTGGGRGPPTAELPRFVAHSEVARLPPKDGIEEAGMLTSG